MMRFARLGVSHSTIPTIETAMRVVRVATIDFFDLDDGRAKLAYAQRDVLRESNGAGGGECRRSRSQRSVSWRFSVFSIQEAGWLSAAKSQVVFEQEATE